MGRNILECKIIDGPLADAEIDLHLGGPGVLDRDGLRIRPQSRPLQFTKIDGCRACGDFGTGCWRNSDTQKCRIEDRAVVRRPALAAFPPVLPVDVAEPGPVSTERSSLLLPIATCGEFAWIIRDDFRRAVFLKQNHREVRRVRICRHWPCGESAKPLGYHDVRRSIQLTFRVSQCQQIDHLAAPAPCVIGKKHGAPIQPATEIAAQSAGVRAGFPAAAGLFDDGPTAHIPGFGARVREQVLCCGG